MEIVVKRIEKVKLSLVFGGTMAIISLLFYPFFLISFFLTRQHMEGFEPVIFHGMFLFMPVFYFIFGFLGSLLFVAIFNFITVKSKGIRIELFETTPQE